MRVSLRRLFASNNAGLHPPLQRKGHARTRALIEQVKWETFRECREALKSGGDWAVQKHSTQRGQRNLEALPSASLPRKGKNGESSLDSSLLSGGDNASLHANGGRGASEGEAFSACSRQKTRFREEPKGRQEASEALLKKVWKRQGELSPNEAAEAAYFLARRSRPPEILLQQLVALAIHANPTRQLSASGLHKLLRVFILAPSSLDRWQLYEMAPDLRRRVRLMPPASLQVLLADLAVLYSPAFLPVFQSAAEALMETPTAPPLCEELRPLDGSPPTDDPRTDSLKEETLPLPPRRFSRECGNLVTESRKCITPTLAAFLLQSFGRTDCRPVGLTRRLARVLEAAVEELAVKQKALYSAAEEASATAGRFVSAAPEGDDGTSSEGDFCSSELKGEVLVMGVRGLANLEAEVQGPFVARLSRLLLPFLLQEKSVLGPLPPSRQSQLLCGSLSSLAKLRAPPKDLRLLVAAAASLRAEDKLSGYDACDLLTAALELQNLLGWRWISAKGDPKEGSSLEGEEGCSSEESFADPWRPLPVSPKLKSAAASFLSPGDCCTALVDAAIGALRPRVFSLHPSFRVCAISALTRLQAVFPLADKRPRRLRREEGEETQVLGRSSQTTARAPLHPLLRELLLTVFYRLAAVPFRLLVALLEALHALDFEGREKSERLTPHEKSARWERPLLQAVGREALRKIHEATPEAAVDFLLLFYGELGGYGVSPHLWSACLNHLVKTSPPSFLDASTALQVLIKEHETNTDFEKTTEGLSPEARDFIEKILTKASVANETSGC